MAIYVRWLVENQVMLTHFVDDIDAEQLHAYLDKSFAMRDAANAANGAYGNLVHTITDASRVTEQNIDLATTQRMMKSLREQRVGWSLYIARNRVDAFIASLAHQFGGIRFKTFNSVDETIAFLADNDESLHDVLTQPLDLSIEETAQV